MHPLELTDLVNGFNISHNGYEESYERLLEDWELFLEWAVASRLNKIEWILLLGPAWEEFGYSEERQGRMRTLVDRCHAFGLVCGVDVPIALVQQNSWSMVGRMSSDPIATMKSNIDWWMAANFDFLTTESGFSEFTQGDCSDMLAWMDTATAYLSDNYNKSLHIKVHISTGQYCEDYLDPDTGEPINFNFLPMFADPRLGILPHTVQMYSYNDPAYVPLSLCEFIWSDAFCPFFFSLLTAARRTAMTTLTTSLTICSARWRAASARLSFTPRRPTGSTMTRRSLSSSLCTATTASATCALSCARSASSARAWPAR